MIEIPPAKLITYCRRGARCHRHSPDSGSSGRFIPVQIAVCPGRRRLPATGIVFRETTTDYENSWHRAPRRQYVISLAGGISITASDGETRHIGAGEIVLVEDTTGKGHITRSSGDKPRHTIFVPID